MSKDQTFEKKIKRLEEIVNQLEEGDYGIEETLKLFQEGMKLSKECKKILDDVELRVNKVLGTDEEENLITENFDDDIQS
ncbi:MULTISPECIES: exodeoxyribonuclease VII small subunit [Flexistipes]|uniref:Exodeoxyribonuclease 7 small subunit n=2 Tax=Flexistipes sinusarabici TaxID=2352 RepID=F8E7E3_FLESM|nr:MULTISPECIES: exodeoxyribonuclease VII small subunit [Flexistipes]AEI14930.1 Exodeoxyribonuclease 7 small subunit [Flexistipes sinusarabici DSM 4947]MEC9493269.1 exodeoxyribonuclease VII small subunit [Flexistipes sp.]TYB33213.1 MAG: exodeoxyribonuclease VII small subunit [Flexistipes sinusarabici]